MNTSIIDTLPILWPVYVVLFLWTLGSALGTYLLALAMISWLEREVTFKELLTGDIGFGRMPKAIPSSQYIDKQFITDNFVKRTK